MNSWLDFEDAFICNFTSTYKRPGKPRQLSMCVQKPGEPLRDFLTRWTELCNSCEGVHKVQAVQYFIDGCLDGTLVKHRLVCDEPKTLAELLVVADKYATADSAMNMKISVDTSGRLLPAQPAPAKPASDSNQCRQDSNTSGKRRLDQPAPRYDNW